MFWRSLNDSACSLKKYFSKIEVCLVFFFLLPPPWFVKRAQFFRFFFRNPSLITKQSFSRSRSAYKSSIKQTYQLNFRENETRIPAFRNNLMNNIIVVTFLVQRFPAKSLAHIPRIPRRSSSAFGFSSLSATQRSKSAS